MTPEPKRKDETKNRDLPEGQKEAAEGDEQAVEEYTDYGEEQPSREEEPEAEREAGLQPDSARGARKGRR